MYRRGEPSLRSPICAYRAVPSPCRCEDCLAREIQRGYARKKTGAAIIPLMKFLRTLLLLLLCAALPLSGLAASGLTGECPMQTSVSAGDGSVMSSDMPDCESMGSSQPEKAKGSFCKATAQCQLGSLYHPVSTPEVARPAGLSSPVVFHYVDSLSVREPAGLWRPPRVN